MNFRRRAWQSFFHRWTVSDFYWAQDQAIAAERQRFVAQLELGAFSIWVPRDWRPNSEKLTFQDLEVPWVSTRNPIDTLKFIETAVQSINSSCFKEGVFFFFRNATPIGMLQPGYLVAFPYPNHQSTFQVITSVGFMVDGEAVTILSTEGSDSDHWRPWQWKLTVLLDGAKGPLRPGCKCLPSKPMHQQNSTK